MVWDSVVKFGWTWNWLKLWLLDLELDIDSEQSRMIYSGNMAMDFGYWIRNYSKHALLSQGMFLGAKCYPIFGQNWNINKLARNDGYRDWRSVGIKATIDIVKILLNSDRDEIDWR